MNVPKLRFKDNNGNDYPQWKKQILGNISDITKLAGFEFTEYVTYQDSGNIIALRGLNVKNNTLDLSDVKYIDNSDFSKLSRSKLYINDLLFTYVGTIGEVALINQNDKYYLAPNVCRIRHYDNVNAIYLLYIFNSNIIKREIYKYLTKSSQPALSMENIRKFKVSLPYLEEQNKIANFLSTVDKKITNLENIITSLENQKKGLLQQIFSQKLRFKDKNGNNYPNWEKKKLGNLFTIKAGGDINKENFSEQYSMKFKYPVYANALTNDGLYGYSNIYKIDKPSITVTGRGINVGFALSRKPFYYPIVRLLVLIPNININFTFFTESINFIHIFNESTGVPQLTAPQLSKVNVYVPNIEEQNKIGNLFDKLNEKIDNKKAQLEHWKQIKKGLLQQMFV